MNYSQNNYLQQQQLQKRPKIQQEIANNALIINGSIIEPPLPLETIAKNGNGQYNPMKITSMQSPPLQKFDEKVVADEKAFFAAIGFEMMGLYQVHNSDKIPFIAQLISEWEGKEIELLVAVRDKYCKYGSDQKCVECNSHQKYGFNQLSDLRSQLQAPQAQLDM